jgi:hypothetical protein
MELDFNRPLGNSTHSILGPTIDGIEFDGRGRITKLGRLVEAPAPEDMVAAPTVQDLILDQLREQTELMRILVAHSRPASL